jgi:beta-lactamase class D
MNKLILLFILISSSAYADCFIAQENDHIILQEGECEKSYAPESTFKIALSLIGFDSGILKDETNPTWVLPQGTDPYINVCKADHNPKTWLRDSCLWYSRLLTQKLGMKKFQDYVQKFNYGNKEVKGESPLINAWVSSSLQISPIEQIVFLQKIVKAKLPVGKESYAHTKNIMYILEMAGGWKLYGKTGNGYIQKQDGTRTDLKHGWFVGYIEKNGLTIEFANHLVDNNKQNTFTSFRARNEALNKLWYLINELEK